jgi:hypothetical protein
MWQTLSISVLFAAIWLAQARPVHAAEETIQDSWYVVKLSGQEIGRQHELVKKLTNARPGVPECYSTSITMDMAFKRLGLRIEMRAATEFVEAPGGAVLSFSHIQTASGASTVVEGTVHGDTATLVITSTGRVARKEIPWDKEILGPYAQNEQIKPEALKGGEVFAFRSFVPEMQRAGNSTLTIGQIEKVTIRGKEMELRKAEHTTDVIPGVVTQTWFDTAGLTWRTVAPLFGGLESVRVDKETAMKAAGGAEFMAGYIIKSNISLTEPNRVVRAVYRMTGPVDGLANVKWEGAMQKVTRRDKESVTLEVASQRAPFDPPADAVALSAEELAPLLSANEFVQSDNAEIRKIATEVTAGAENQVAAAKRLEKWVHEAIRKKDMSMAFASAAEALETREGDCSEHAVLLAALCRAISIPARLSAGLLFVHEAKDFASKDFFGYHLWTEIYCNRQWIALEPTNLSDSGYVDAMHIALWSERMDMPSMAEMGVRLAAVVGQLKIEVIEYQMDDGTVTVVSAK